ncbi:MAG: ComEA family DNA-binding protein [Candidatus Acidiferrales bacterium]
MRHRVAGKFLTVTFAVALLAAIACLAKQPPEKPIDLNTATAEQLEQLPGIGPKIAEAIVAFREKSGPFRRVEDLLAIRGISKRKLNAIRPYVKVAPPPPKSSLLLRSGAAEISARAG